MRRYTFIYEVDDEFDTTPEEDLKALQDRSFKVEDLDEMSIDFDHIERTITVEEI